MQQRIASLVVNPLESSAADKILAAVRRYQRLIDDARNGKLLRRIDRSRRAELGSDRETKKQVLRDDLFNVGTFGIYTHRARPSPHNAWRLDNYGRTVYELAFLDRLQERGCRKNRLIIPITALLSLLRF